MLIPKHRRLYLSTNNNNTYNSRNKSRGIFFPNEKLIRITIYCLDFFFCRWKSPFTSFLWLLQLFSNKTYSQRTYSKQSRTIPRRFWLTHGVKWLTTFFDYYTWNVQYFHIYKRFCVGQISSWRYLCKGESMKVSIIFLNHIFVCIILQHISCQNEQVRFPLTRWILAFGDVKKWLYAESPVSMKKKPPMKPYTIDDI